MVAMSSTPWSVVLDYSHDLAFVLAVRDALGIADPLGLPAVHPPQAVVIASALQADSELDAQWQRWWERALPFTEQANSEHQPLPDGPLGHVVGENLGALRLWSAERKREVAQAGKPTRGTPRLRDVLRDHEQSTGLPLGGFRLRVTALPLAGPVFLPLDSNRIVVSITLLQDRTNYHRHLLEHVAPTAS
ncbi:hypothetical protein P3T36_006409 [Kitasatospora sp. MAP12-15]|uniref:hypothetical protein n=1 Tax=unclassified Kitasatospora TaxID=2633591 RepID=UPI0024753563|nr:hypothetical protein [Kitasatospora sp. MAP12-44]MDH6107796.1 hypothetical protein [Kitasatospora sp. MAP12-44]